MDLHHVGQLVDGDFEGAVTFYGDTVGLPLGETTDGAVWVAFFELASAEVHLIVREERGSPADKLLDTISQQSTAHVASEVDDLAAAMRDAANARLTFVGDLPTPGLGPYRRAFVEPRGHAGIPFEFVEP